MALPHLYLVYPIAHGEDRYEFNLYNHIKKDFFNIGASMNELLHRELSKGV